MKAKKEKRKNLKREDKKIDKKLNGAARRRLKSKIKNRFFRQVRAEHSNIKYIKYIDRGNVCVCVFFPFILDIKFVGRTSRGHTGFLIHLSAVRALIFLARRIQPFLSLDDREVEFCVLTI